MKRYTEASPGYEVVELKGTVHYEDRREVPYRAQKGGVVQYFPTLREALDFISPGVTHKWSE